MRIFKRWEKGEGESLKDGRKVKEILQKFSKKEGDCKYCMHICTDLECGAETTG
jgi:hypothetical protein